MAEIGTYSASVYAQTPIAKILPEPNDILTFDWMDSVGLFSQRFLRVATMTATVANGAYADFDFSSLRCDYFPPIFALYHRGGLVSGWNVFSTESTGWYNSYFEISHIGLGTCRVNNNTGTAQIILVKAYL